VLLHIYAITEGLIIPKSFAYFFAVITPIELLRLKFDVADGSTLTILHDAE
jgi:hypothetical protein